MNFDELRNKYPSFIFDSYSIKKNNELLEITYNFIIEGLTSFKAEWIIKDNNNSEIKDIEELVFSLGLIELISYWKLTCSPVVKVSAGFLDNEQIIWWKKLYFNGLGEFFYINNIKTDINNFIDIQVTTKRNDYNISKIPLKGSLIPIGGGKDSIVTLHLLKEDLSINNCYYIKEQNVKKFVDNKLAGIAQIAGYKNDNIISVTRVLDKKLIELSKKFLNGHTPFSAIIAFSSILVAYLNRKKYVVLSNESGANESTILNKNINHQYSKSYEFEKDFNWYINKYLKLEIKYFSILRPLSELQIAKYFSKLTEYHNIFRSCNVGSKDEKWIWCCKCSKCLFVFIILSAFLDIDYLINIFDDNLLEREDLLKEMQKLVGIIDDKPFECVGPRDEVNIAICMAINKIKESNEQIPYLYKEYMNSDLYNEYNQMKNKYSKYYDKQNNLPVYFAKIIKNNFNVGE